MDDRLARDHVRAGVGGHRHEELLGAAGRVQRVTHVPLVDQVELDDALVVFPREPFHEVGLPDLPGTRHQKRLVGVVVLPVQQVFLDLSPEHGSASSGFCQQ